MSRVAVRGVVACSTCVAAFAFTALAMASLATGCSPSPPPESPGTLQVDIDVSPTSTDPRFATDASSSRINELIFDSLVKLDARGEFQGELAKSIERPSSREIVYHLRRGVRFSNGQELTSRDVKFTYDSVLDSASLSPKRAGFAQLAALTTPDAYTVVMTTREPYAPALEMAMLGIVPDGTPLPSRRGDTSPPGTGPFK
ncbi:MAG: ABC transporter substrate-binding protein, partial [Candidatus Binataceae bacterium]